MAYKTADKLLLLLIVHGLSFLFIQLSFSQSQPYAFKQFPLPGDLPNIERMFEDRFGYIWLGTSEGLYRFDGTNYTLYTSKDPHIGLRREVITGMFEDKDLNFWVGAKSGLYRYDPLKKDFDKFSNGDDLFPQFMHQENDTCFLVQCYMKNYLFYPAKNRWEQLMTGVKVGETYSFQRGKNNDLWIGTSGKVVRYDLATGISFDYPLPVPSFAKAGENITVANMYMDSHEQLWINTWYKGLVRLDTKTGEFEQFDTLRSSQKGYLLELYVSSITEDGDGNIWLANTSRGINIYHYPSGSFTYILTGMNYTHGLVGNEFGLLADREKNIWVKSDHNLHYLAKNTPVPELKSEPGVFLQDARCLRFLQPDYILVGTYFGLDGINLKTNKVTALNSVIQLPPTHNAEFQTVGDVMVDRDKTLWICSPQGVRELQWKDIDKSDPVISFKRLYPTRNGFLPSKLFPLNDSLVFIKGRINTNTFATFNTRSGEYDYHTLPDSINFAIPHNKDTILLAIRNKGLFYYQLKDRTKTFIPWKFKDGAVTVTSPVFYKIVRLQDGRYAIASENYGLFLFNPDTQDFKYVDVAAVANTNLVYSVMEDQQQNLWIETSKQLLFYNRKDETISKFNLSNSFDSYLPSFFIHEGVELYGIFEGSLYKFKLEDLFFKTQRPRLYLQSITTRDKEIDWQDAEKVRLSFSDNFLSFDFVGLDYDNPQGLKYWYKIPGINDAWQDLGNQKSISFGRLPPGKYQFHLKVSNEVGLWSEEVLSPFIVIAPPFWRSWWFILGVVSLMAGVTSYFIKLRKNKREAEVQLRNQIARDLHDDIGSTLSGIKIFSTIASGMSGSNKDLSSLLQQIQDKSDLMMHSMSDIVWSINPTHDTLYDMMIRLKQYMSEVLENQNTEVHYATQVDLKNMKIQLKHRKELYLAMKEIINNAAKYAGCNNFYLDIRKQKGDIIIEIRDDGIGMEEKDIVFGNGLKNIESRIQFIGGKVFRESSPGKGTRYEIRVTAS